MTWQPWFAWYPVKLSTGWTPWRHEPYAFHTWVEDGWVRWRWIERRLVGANWEYRLQL